MRYIYDKKKTSQHNVLLTRANRRGSCGPRSLTRLRTEVPRPEAAAAAGEPSAAARATAARAPPAAAQATVSCRARQPTGIHSRLN